MSNKASKYHAIVILDKATGGHRYQIMQGGVPLLTSGVFYAASDALRAGSRIAEDEAAMADYLERVRNLDA